MKVQSAEPEGFEEFWIFWRQTKRHTDGRGKCRKEYQRQLNEGAEPEDILLAAQWHVRNTKDTAFIPLAATWLNAESWRDDAPRERAYQASLSQKQKSNVVQMAPGPTGQTAFLRKFNQQKQEA